MSLHALCARVCVVQLPTVKHLLFQAAISVLLGRFAWVRTAASSSTTTARHRRVVGAIFWAVLNLWKAFGYPLMQHEMAMLLLKFGDGYNDSASLPRPPLGIAACAAPAPHRRSLLGVRSQLDLSMCLWSDAE